MKVIFLLPSNAQHKVWPCQQGDWRGLLHWWPLNQLISSRLDGDRGDPALEGSLKTFPDLLSTLLRTQLVREARVFVRGVETPGKPCPDHVQMCISKHLLLLTALMPLVGRSQFRLQLETLRTLHHTVSERSCCRLADSWSSLWWFCIWEGSRRWGLSCEMLWGPGMQTARRKREREGLCCSVPSDTLLWNFSPQCSCNWCSATHTKMGSEGNWPWCRKKWKYFREC